MGVFQQVTNKNKLKIAITRVTGFNDIHSFLLYIYILSDGSSDLRAFHQTGTPDILDTLYSDVTLLDLVQLTVSVW